MGLSLTELIVRGGVIFLLDLTRISICLLFLLIASFHDIRSREVPDAVWILFAPLGLALTLSSFILGGLDIQFIFMWILIIAMTSCLSIALFYLGLFGGADAKALICLAAAMPLQPNLSLAKLFAGHSIQPFIPPPISTFNNAVLLAALSTIPILVRNLVDYMRNKRIFEGLEHEGLLKKAISLLTGYRVDVDKLRSGRHHYLLMEEFIEREDGSVVKRLKVFSRLPTDENWPKEMLPAALRGKVWVTPGLPFIVFITLGFSAAMLVGDIIFLLVNIALIH
ncbi:MAG: A24 family peptidase C-terminal domain-containing protein [Candidatus Bathyarchaeia archaeon]